MNDLIQYFLEASLVMAVLYGFFHLALRNDTFFKFNRTYLLGAMVLTITLPLVNVNFTNASEVSNGLTQTLHTIQLPAVTVDSASTNTFNWWQLGGLIYGAVVIILISRLTVRLIGIARLARKYPSHRQGGIVWIDSEEPATFSFFNWLFLAPKHRGDKVVATSIINHEKAHIQQGHSWDVIAAEMFTAAFWINPFSWLLNRAIRQNHEYLADEAALHDRTERENYARLIVHDASRQRQVVFGNHFSQFQIKRRLTMLYRNTSWYWVAAKSMLFVPMLAGLVIMSCQSENISEIQSTNGDKPLTSINEVDVSPTYKGGNQQLYQELYDKIQYPEELQPEKIEGTVFLSFVINENGELSQVEIMQGIHPKMDKIAVEAVESLGEWNPAIKDGKPVPVKFNLPIKFSLE